MPVTNNTAAADKSTTDTLARALDYARHGYKVFPVRRDKKPFCGSHGFKDGTTDPDTVRRHWERHPDANIAVWLPERVIVLDVETMAGHDVDGLAKLAALQAELGPLPDTGPLASTATGGLHYWLTIPKNVDPYPHPWPGIDVKTHTGYVVVPCPGSGRRWIRKLSCPQPPCPQTWLAQIRKPAAPKTNGQHSTHTSFDATRGRNPAYVKGAVEDELAILAATKTYRDDQLFKSVAALAEFADVDREWLRSEATAIANSIGLDVDHNCGPEGIKTTIRSAFKAADRSGWRVIPEPKTKADSAEIETPSDTDEDEDAGQNQIPHITRTTEQRAAALAEAHTVFRKWLGDDYDLDALDVMLAAAAVEQLDGDPLWLLLISGSGNAKTETVQALNGVAAHVVSTIASEGALLSASSRRDKAKNATGGLLRVVGERGILAIKDFTTILSMDRNIRGQVLAALREIYDGYWSRNVGTDGGKTLEWKGRIVIIGAVTTAWDAAHTVIATMGDRFVLCRIDSTTHRIPSGRQAIGNTGNETAMRAELAAAVADVLAGAADTATEVTDDETEAMLAAADLVTLARTGVEFDYRGDVIDAHAPEMPTRFAKQLAQVVRGAAAVGITKDDAMRLAIRCARDSVPPLRLAIIDYLAANPVSTTGDVRTGIDKPRSTVDRQLQALHMLGVAEVDECDGLSQKGDQRTKWYYSLRGDIDPKSLAVPQKMQPGTTLYA